VIVRESIPRYEEAAGTKKEKSRVVVDIVDRIRNERPEGGFIRKDYYSGRWVEIGESKAREKVGHAIRIEIRKQRKTGLSAQRPTAAALLQQQPSTRKRRTSPETFAASPSPDNLKGLSLTMPSETFLSMVQEHQETLSPNTTFMKAGSSALPSRATSDDSSKKRSPIRHHPARMSNMMISPLPTPGIQLPMEDNILIQAEEDTFAPRRLPLPGHKTVLESVLQEAKDCSSSSSSGGPASLSLSSKAEKGDEVVLAEDASVRKGRYHRRKHYGSDFVPL
jgi:hypothetical protein